MQSLTLNFQNSQIFDKFMWLLDHFKKDGVEIVSKEDIDDLKGLGKNTRGKRGYDLYWSCIASSREL